MTYDVVVVDDSPDIRLLLKVALDQSEHFRVTGQAADGQSGVAAAAEHQPDVVLLDVAMPVMDGLEALPKVKRASPRSCVVMLSGYSEFAALKGAREAGAFAYIEKGDLASTLVPQLLHVMSDFRRPSFAR